MSFVRRLLARKTEKPTELTRQQTGPTAPTIDAGESMSREGSTEPTAAEALDQDPVQLADNTTRDKGDSTRSEDNVARRDALPDKALRIGYASDVGKLRDHNEDTLIVFRAAQLGDDTSDPFGFFVVADGMGGHRAGEVASSMAARLVSREVLEKVYLPFLLKKTPGLSMEPLTEILRDAVHKANDQVHTQIPGGGTTLTCALVVGQRAYIAHVGDSRAYLLTDNGIRRVTQDHSYVGRLIELGELSPEEAAVHPQRHVLYRAIGQGEQLDIDTYHQPLPSGSRLLLCSDGLSGLVSENDIGKIVNAAATPQEACASLVEAANAAGGPDNITAVLIETRPHQ